MLGTGGGAWTREGGDPKHTLQKPCANLLLVAPAERENSFLLQNVTSDHGEVIHRGEAHKKIVPGRVHFPRSSPFGYNKKERCARDSTRFAAKVAKNGSPRFAAVRRGSPRFAITKTPPHLTFLGRKSIANVLECFFINVVD